MEKEIKNTLKAILEYVGVDLKYVDDAQLHAYLEWLIGKSKNQ